MRPSATRIVLAGLTGAALAIAAGANALANSGWKASPALAERLWSGQANAMVRRGETAFAKGPTAPQHLAEAKRRARAALRAQAAHGKALQLLGLVANARGEQAAAARLMSLSEQLSRRNGFVQLWFVDNDARAGRTADALSHFDIAMNASPALNGKLYPVLANALRDPAIRREFAGYVRREPEWLPSFLGYAVDQGNNPEAIARALIDAGGLPPGKNYDATVALLLGKLAASGKFGATLELYQVQAPKAQVAATSSLGFEAASIDPRFTPVTWEFLPSDSGQASLIPPAQGAAPAVRLEAYEAARVEAARKVLFLQPGRYRLGYAVKELSEGARGGLKLSLACGGRGGPMLAEVALEATGNRTIMVPAGCAAQVVALSIVGATGSTPFEAALTRLSITPA